MALRPFHLNCRQKPLTQVMLVPVDTPMGTLCIEYERGSVLSPGPCARVVLRGVAAAVAPSLRTLNLAQNTLTAGLQINRQSSSSPLDDH